MKIIDISLPLSVDLPVWPNSQGFQIRQIACCESDGYNESVLTMGTHVGTHIDAPKHFFDEGVSVDQLKIETLIGEAFVVSIDGPLSADVLGTIDLPDKVERLLLKTSNSELWRTKQQTFFENYDAITSDGAEWLVGRGIKLVGIDYLSIQQFGDSNLTHKILLAAGVVILEGLNLSAVNDGTYELICLPLSIRGAEGAPARAILRY